MRWVCLMVLSVVLSSAAAAVLAADADPSGAGLSRSRATAVAARAAQPRRAGRKRSSKRTRCVAASRGRRHAKRHRKAHRRCVVKRSKRRATKPGAGGGSSPAPVSPGPGAPAGGAGTPTSGAPASPVSPSEAAGPFRFFSATSFWNESVPADAPLDPSSTAIVGAFENEIAKAEKAKKGLPSINTTAWSVPIYTVPAGQPTVRVTHAGTSECDRVAVGVGCGAAAGGRSAGGRHRQTPGGVAAEQRQAVGVLAPGRRRRQLAGVVGRRDAQRIVGFGRLRPRSLAGRGVELGSERRRRCRSPVD